MAQAPAEGPPFPSDNRKTLEEQLEDLHVANGGTLSRSVDSTSASIEQAAPGPKDGGYKSKGPVKRRGRRGQTSQPGPNDEIVSEDAGTVASVPFMITNAMRASMQMQGYPEDFRRSLTPEEAHAVIDSGLTYEQWLVRSEEQDQLLAPETPKERREALRDAVHSSSDSSEEEKKSIHDAPRQSVAEAERADVTQKEAAYLAAYKELEQKRTLWNRLLKGKDLSEESEKVDSLKTAYDDARVTYANALTQSAEDRLLQRGMSGVLSASGVPSEAIVARYNRLVRFNEVVKPAMEKKLLARQEALDARGRNALTRALGWSAEANRKLEGTYGKSGARALRAAASAIIITGGVAGLTVAGVAAPMGIAALAGYGTFKFGRSLFGAIAGAAAGETAANTFEAVWGRRSQRAAEEQLKGEGRASDISRESLQAIDVSREKLSIKADEMTLIKRKQLIQALTALGVGASAAITLAEFTSMQHAAEAAVTGTTPDGHPISQLLKDPANTLPHKEAGQGIDATQAPAGAPNAAGIGEHTPQSPAAPENMLQGAVVEHGEGFNKLFVDLRASIKSDFPDMANTSPVVKELFSMSPTELSDRVGAFDPETGTSMPMQQGDQLILDEHGNLWFEKFGAEKPQLLMEADPKDPTQVITHEIQGAEMRGGVPDAAPKASEARSAATTETPSSVEMATSPDEASPENGASMAGASGDDAGSEVRGESVDAPGTDVPVTPADPTLSAESSIETGALAIDSAAASPDAPQSPEAPSSQLTLESVTGGPIPVAAAGESPISGGTLRVEDTLKDASPANMFTNAHGVEILPSAPHDYEWKVPGTNLTYTVAYGGSPEEIRDFASREIAINPEAKILINTVVVDPSGGTMIRVDAWQLGPDGSPVREEGIVHPGTGNALPPITTEDFIRKLP